MKMDREENIKLKYAQNFANHLSRMLDKLTEGKVYLSASQKLILTDEIKYQFDLVISELNG